MRSLSQILSNDIGRSFGGSFVIGLRPDLRK
jgi:hypothetical protein